MRVKLSEIFNETHRLLLKLYHCGLIGDFRIDQSDGLADPIAYLKQLAGECERGTPIWVEKILESSEHLPLDMTTLQVPKRSVERFVGRTSSDVIL